MGTPKRLCIPRDLGGIGEEEAGALGGCAVPAEAEDAHALDSEDFGKFAMMSMAGIDLFLQGSRILRLALADKERPCSRVDDMVGGEWRAEGQEGLGARNEMAHH